MGHHTVKAFSTFKMTTHKSFERVMKTLITRLRKSRPQNVMPILDWGWNYDFKHALLGDCIAGITVAIMQVLSSMADAQLANIDLVRGLYCSIFPVFMYVVFGPSRHISVGTNSLICMMLGQALEKHKNELAQHFQVETDCVLKDTMKDDSCSAKVHNQLMATVVIIVAIFQLLLAFLQAGKLSWLFSDIAMSGFMTGAGVAILTSQLKTLFGLEVEALPSPNMKVYYDLKNFVLNITDPNWTCIGISAVSIILLILNEEYAKPLMIRKIGVPIPLQMLLVVVGIPLSYHFQFHDQFDVPIVGVIPQKLPDPSDSMPDFGIIKDDPKLLADCLMIALVGFGFSLSMGKFIAKRFNYKLDGNQELLAEGMCNSFGAFFQCIPASASMSRSMTQATAGGTTQLTGFISAVILITVLTSTGKVLHDLPKCILSSVIVVALKGVLFQVKDFPGILKKSKLDGLLWVGPFFGVILIDLTWGFVICIGLAILIMTYRNYKIDILEFGIEDDDSHSSSQSNSSNSSALYTKMAIRVSGVVSFANYELLLKKCNKKLDKINTVGGNQKPLFIVDLKSVPYIDQTACKALIEWIGSVDNKAHLAIVAHDGKVKEMLRAHDYDEVKFFENLKNAMLSKEMNNIPILNVIETTETGAVKNETSQVDIPSISSNVDTNHLKRSNSDPGRIEAGIEANWFNHDLARYLQITSSNTSTRKMSNTSILVPPSRKTSFSSHDIPF